MGIWAWILVVLVGTLNIAFNIQAQRAALSAESWSDGLLSLQFLVLFLIGCASLLALYTLYLQEVPLARGILLMGAVSILGGTSIALYIRGNQLELVEWFILATITVLFIFRFVKTISR
jgi:hypothetical protein